MIPQVNRKKKKYSVGERGIEEQSRYVESSPLGLRRLRYYVVGTGNFDIGSISSDLTVYGSLWDYRA
jgi:hypothetical protein